jgi:hypothetical protein
MAATLAASRFRMEVSQTAAAPEARTPGVSAVRAGVAADAAVTQTVAWVVGAAVLPWMAVTVTSAAEAAMPPVVSV